MCVWYDDSIDRTYGDVGKLESVAVVISSYIMLLKNCSDTSNAILDMR